MKKLVKVTSEVLNIHEEPISDENAHIELSMGELQRIIEKYNSSNSVEPPTCQYASMSLSMSNLNYTEKEKGWIEIAKFLNHNGFSQYGNGRFWHMYFGPEYVFDLSECNTDKWSIMSKIFEKAVEFGRQQKTAEIAKALGINTTI